MYMPYLYILAITSWMDPNLNAMCWSSSCTGYPVMLRKEFMELYQTVMRERRTAFCIMKH